ncbi:Endonuclease/exonuclease/phosphatase [Cyathus striatus]|nr:Endonuclease/exonuclease/phosphatase [Cyathus striatus]
MRIMTWNINGVRTLPQYHPWNKLKTHDDILQALEADVLCFQEMKSSRQGLPKEVAVPPNYDSFFSFPVKKSGYSGVAIYTRSSVVVPSKAEEGLTGLIQPKPSLSAAERISPLASYPPHVDIEDEVELDFKDLDTEGRGLVIDFGLFVLINVYCPNDGTGSPERDVYKSQYHTLLSARVRDLISEGREVMVVGDINACAGVTDHCEAPIIRRRAEAEGKNEDEVFYEEKEGRMWLKRWLVESGGPMIDIVRRFWPDRKGMYTCWNTKISARESNYGTRIDYILITAGLLPWIKGADIQPQIKGSDHCPVYVDLHDEIVDPGGNTVALKDNVCFNGVKKDLPRLAAKFWDEHSGKQRLLGQFFVKKGSTAARDSQSEETPTPSPTVTNVTPTLQSLKDPNTAPIPRHVPSDTTPPVPSSSSSKSPQSPSTTSLSSTAPTVSRPSITSQPLKRKATADPPPRKKLKPEKQTEKVKGKIGVGPEQANLASYFGKSKGAESGSAASSSKSKSKSKAKIREPAEAQPSDSPAVDEDADYNFALLLSQESNASTSSNTSAKNTKSSETWSSLLAPIQPPNCIVHGEPAKEFTVNKPGPNRGKKFFICSRPVGPGYDKGRAERLREDVDPQWRCNFFKWSSEVKREMLNW